MQWTKYQNNNVLHKTGFYGLMADTVLTFPPTCVTQERICRFDAHLKNGLKRLAPGSLANLNLLSITATPHMLVSLSASLNQVPSRRPQGAVSMTSAAPAEQAAYVKRSNLFSLLIKKHSNGHICSSETSVCSHAGIRETLPPPQSK